MSTATFFSRLNIADSCCAFTWPTIWLLWRRIARNILKWLIAGSRIKITPMVKRVCCGRRLSGMTKWSKIVTKTQADAVMTVVLAIPEKKSYLCYPQAGQENNNMYIFIYLHIFNCQHKMLIMIWNALFWSKMLIIGPFWVIQSSYMEIIMSGFIKTV